MRVFGDRMLTAHHRKYFVDLARGTEVQAAFEAQLEIEGTKRSILSTMLNMPINDYRDGYRALCAPTTPAAVLADSREAGFVLPDIRCQPPGAGGQGRSRAVHPRRVPQR